MVQCRITRRGRSVLMHYIDHYVDFIVILIKSHSFFTYLIEKVANAYHRTTSPRFRYRSQFINYATANQDIKVVELREA